ncbi:MAG: AAA family ATPase, partial [Pseudomonadota bacterium]|nr:AAA family ATPase [Pseudomonadota bacterium]
MPRRASLAKITPPKLSGVYPRERLFKLLDEGRRCPVVWICGLPGAGKTTLAISYLQALQLGTVWYRLDEDDADPATLFYYLGLAAKKAAPRRKKPLPLFTPEYLKGFPAFSRHYFRDLYARLPQPFVVVFDNYHDIGTESPTHEVMRYALEEVPSHGNVIVLSRTEPPEQLARLRANNEIQLVGPETMRLTLEESRGLLASHHGLPLSEEYLKQLIEQTQGWAAGLILLSELGESAAPPPAIHDSRQLQAVFDYFAGEILCRTDSETQEVLLATALLPVFTAPLAENFTGRPHA